MKNYLISQDSTRSLIKRTFKFSNIWKPKLLAVFFVLIALFSCEKDAIYNSNKGNQLNFDAFKELYVDEDLEGQKINEILLLTALAFDKVMNSSEFRSYILKELEQDPFGQGISLVELGDKNSDFANSLAEELYLNMIGQELPEHLKPLLSVPKIDIIRKFQEMMVHQNESYNLAVYRIKSNNTGVITPRDGGYITAIASDIEDDPNDEILAFIDSDTFLLSEATAMATTQTIVFVGDGAREQINFTDPTTEPKIQPRVDEIDIKVDQFRIQSGHRYDGDRYSEVILYYLQFTDLESPIEHYESDDFDPKKVHKNDIDNTSGGTVFNNDEDFFNMNQSEFNSNNNVHIGAFECDWYASLKALDPTCGDFPGPQADVAYVRMKFSNEWYFFECLDVPTWWPSVGSFWSVALNNAKCDFRLKRIAQ